MRLIDSHCHLQSHEFDDDRLEVLAAARLGGVEWMLVPGWDVASSEASIAFVRGRPGLLGSAGAHPHVADQVDDAVWAKLTELATDPLVAAIGETGLDYDRGFSSQEGQLANLRRHIGLSREAGKPLILHCRSKPGERDAQDHLMRELEAGGRPPALLHSFSGPVDYAERALELGCAVSFSGLVFRGGEEASADVARLVPIDRLLVETDSPYLSPPGAPRRRNEPSWVKVTARWLAEQRDMTPDVLGEQLVANFDRIFGVQFP